MSFVDSSTYYIWDAQDYPDLLPSSVDEAASILSQCLNIEAEVQSDNVLRFAEELEKKARSGEFDGEFSLTFGATVQHVKAQNTIAISLPQLNHNLRRLHDIVRPLCEAYQVVFYDVFMGYLILPDGTIHTR